MGVLTSSDVVELIGYFVGSFGLGFVNGAVLRLFRRLFEKAFS